MSSRRRIVRAAIPWLRAAITSARESASLPELPALRWICGRGNAARAPEGDWREWLLSGLDAATAAEFRRWPAGPSLAAAAGAGLGAAPGWAVAQPVHLVAGMDHVRLAPLAGAVLSEEEARELGATLQEHFRGDALELLDFTEGAWLVRCDERLDCRTHDPAAVVGLDIHDHLPSGEDGARLRSHMNEIQMLLHEHPVNTRRASAGAAPINGLWLWGFGAAHAAPEPRAPVRQGTLRSDDLWLRAFWRVHGGAVLEPGANDAGEGLELWGFSQPHAPEPAEALAQLDAGAFAQLVREAQAGGLGALELHDGARVRTLDRLSRLRIWRRPAPAERL